MQRKTLIMINVKSSKLNILFLTPSFIYPTIGGDKIKPYKVVEHLARTHNVTLLCINSEKEIDKNRYSALESLGVKVLSHSTNFYLSAIKALFKTTFDGPLEAEFFNSTALNNKVKQIVQSEKIDLIINYFERTAECVKHLPIPKILLADDSRTLYQERTVKTSKSIFQKMKRLWEVRKIKQYETELYDFFDVVTLVSDEDIAFARQLNNTANYMTVSNGVELEKFKSNQAFEHRKDIYFIGKLDVWVNQIMIDRLLHEIFPVIKKRVPDVRLFLVGFNPKRKLVNSLPRDVYVIDSPESVVPYYDKARLFIHPQFEGSGIQNKLLEALAMSCPAVSTPIGSQGINIINRESGIIAKNIEEIIEAAINVLTDDELAKKLSINARKLVEQEYSWDKVFAQIDLAINNALE